jgi:hypothetical protein
MKRETIFESNPYLRDQGSYADQLVASVASSTAVEIGRIKLSLRKALVARAGAKKSKISSRAKCSS